jgi:predicted nuclease with TOPRIM domain
MKKTILTHAIAGAMVVASFTAFGQEKAPEPTKNVMEAPRDLGQAKIDSAADFQKFKKEAEVNISNNQKKIELLKTNESSDTQEVKDKYDSDVLALEQKNAALEKKINESDKTKTSDWSSFKREFNFDMDELWAAIKDVGVNDPK